jgi:hypothetical protein
LLYLCQAEKQHIAELSNAFFGEAVENCFSSKMGSYYWPCSPNTAAGHKLARKSKHIPGRMGAGGYVWIGKQQKENKFLAKFS